MILCHVIDKGYSVFRELDQQIRPSFKLKEFMCREHKGEVILNNKQLDLVQSIRDYLNKPIRITSHHRTPEYNKKVDGYKRSCHMKGTATDLAVNPNDFTDEQLNKLVEHAVMNGAKEIGIYRRQNFIHFAIESTSKNTNREHNGIKYRIFYGK